MFATITALDLCGPPPTLTTALAGTTITVETSEVKMVWDSAEGGGLREFYGKLEPNASVSRVGDSARYNLFTTQLNDGVWHFETDTAGTLDLLEATPTRVRVRQKYDFTPTVHLDRDWTAYPYPRLAIDDTLAVDGSVDIRGAEGIHAKGETTCPGNTFYCAGKPEPSPDSSDPLPAGLVFLVTDNLSTYSDMLAIPYSAPFFGRAGTAQSWEAGPEVGTPNSSFSRVREGFVLTPTSGSNTRFYLFYPHLAGLTSAGGEWQPYADDYRNPDTFTIVAGVGGGWFDPAENTTSPADFFNEAENAYTLELDPAQGVRFAIDGALVTRRKPFFKMRHWRSLEPPATVSLDGATLTRNVHYLADVKPISRAHFCTPACTELANGGLVGAANEYLNNPAANFTLNFTGANAFYLGADSKFRGLNVALATIGAGDADLQWQYWNGTGWANLEVVAGFVDETNSFRADGSIHWAGDPAGWTTRTVDGSPLLYYVRAVLASGSYAIQPVESRIRTDILLFQHLSEITAAGQTFAFGPPVTTTNYRSIGTRGNYGAGGPEGGSTTVTVTNGSTLVAGASTTWRASNRGRGDRIIIPCPDPPTCAAGTSYTVLQVHSDTQLELTSPFTGSSGSGLSYTIARQYADPFGWLNCIANITACPFFPVASPNLVADNRSETGIMYNDGAPYVFGATLAFDGTTTDATHDIVLTADHGNRHHGVPGAGVVIDVPGGASAIRLSDDWVTVEWLEITDTAPLGLRGLQVATIESGSNKLVIRNMLIHDLPGGSAIAFAGDRASDIYDNVIHDTGSHGIDLGGTMLINQIDIDNNTIFRCAGNGIRSGAGANPNVTLRNNIAVSNVGPQFNVLGLNLASSNNLASDGSGTVHSTSGGINGVTATADPVNCPSGNCVGFMSLTAGSVNLHLINTTYTNQAVNAAADLSGTFTTDVDAGLRPTGANTWDIGADELQAMTGPDLSLTAADGQASAVPGQSVTYTITVTNNGPGVVSSLTLMDTIDASSPPGAVTLSAFVASSGSYDPVLELWTVALAVGQSETLTLTFDISPSARGQLVYAATVLGPVADPDPADNQAVDTDTLSPEADLALDKIDDQEPALLGGLLTYTLTVTNGGDSDATGVTVTDVLPVDMELDAEAGAIDPSQGSCSFDAVTQTVRCDLGVIASTGLATVTIKVRPRAVKNFLNTASVTRSEPDPISGNDSDPEPTTVQIGSFDVGSFTVTSRHQRNQLEWVNPTAAGYLSTEIMVRGDGFPEGPSDPLATSLYNDNDADLRGSWRIAHDTGPGSNGQTFYYAAFVHRSSAPTLSAGRFVTGRPFDHTTGPVKWAFSTGATALAAPTVSGVGVIATSNDRNVYAMKRGLDFDLTPPDSGEWPASFRPVTLGGAVQLRSPVVPLTAFSNPVAYFGAQDGKVYMVDAVLGSLGSLPWSSTVVGPMVQAAPAGIFIDYLGDFDQLLIGTRDADNPNAFVALDPLSGAAVDSYDNGAGGSIGVVSGMAAVAYDSPPRVYFTSNARGTANTLWAFALAAAPTVFNPIWAKQLGDIESSPVLRNGRVLVGSPQNGGTIHSFEALLGGGERTFIHNDGQVRGFVFPDRTSNDIYFATDDFVWGATDTGAAMMPNKFTGPISLPGGARPSPVLFVSDTKLLYMGGSDGKLYEIDTQQASPVPNPVTLGDGLAVVGAPSFDRENNLIHVGSEAGIFYAVAVPFPCVPTASCTTTNGGQACWVSSTAECANKTCTGIAGDCQVTCIPAGACTPSNFGAPCWVTDTSECSGTPKTCNGGTGVSACQ
jgi:uncharacterized repeat protein (TIGR01451 family)